MLWYVRHEDGDIWGPMSKAEAESMRDQLDDACMFDERIFSPRFVTNAEVEGLLADLRGMKDGEDDALGELCQRAADTITLLCNERLVTGTIQGGVLDLDPLPLGVSVDIRDYDTDGVDSENLEEAEDGRPFFQAG